jgi:hypothetical protein
MRPYHCILFLLIVSCQTRTSKDSTNIDSTYNLTNLKPPDIRSDKQQVDNDSVYNVGDYLFVGDKDLVFDFFRNGHPPRRLKSKGDTLYSDNSFTILVDYKKALGTVYKKYTPKYRFEDFKVSDLYTGQMAKPNFLTDPPARGFRTVIREACSDSAINFAGHYTIAEWGCGTECEMMALVDRISGRVFYSNKYLPYDSVDGHWGISFRKDSRLLVVNSYLLEDYPGYVMQSWRKLSFYKWTGNGLRRLK